MKDLDDGPDGLNDAAFNRALGCMQNGSTSVFGLRDGQHTAGTKYLIGKIRALGAKVVLARTGRVSIVSATGARRVYTLKLDEKLVAESRMEYLSADVQVRLGTANSPLAQALADLAATQTPEEV